MGKIRLSLSYKNILILKHSLEHRIEQEKRVLSHIEESRVNPFSEEKLKEFQKEHEEHKRCYKDLVDAISEGGYRSEAGEEKKILGERYLTSHQARFENN